MSRGYQKYIASGNVTADPKIYAVKESDDGSIVASCDLAIGREWKDPETGETQEAVTYVSLRFFGGLAKTVEKYVKKGKALLIEGEVRNSRYTDKDGIERFSNEIHVSELVLGPDPKGAQQ